MLQSLLGLDFEVMKATSAVDEYELQLVAAQDGLVKPDDWFEAKALRYGGI